MDSSGDFVVSWQSYGQDTSGGGIYAQRYKNDGTKNGSEFKVNTYITSDQTKPSVSMRNNGDFFITWGSRNQDGSNYGIFGQRYTSTGLTNGIEFQVNSYTTGNQVLPSVALDNDGDFVITWSGPGTGDNGIEGVFLRRYTFN